VTPSWIAALNAALTREGIDVERLGLAWARVTPAVTLIPAFGLRALPAPARALLALAMAAVIFPAVAGADPGAAGMWRASALVWLLHALVEVARGLPVAIAAAVPLWAATMAGGVADALRGSNDAPTVPVVEGRATPTGVPMSLLASAIFLTTGGPSRVARALASDAGFAHPVVAAVRNIAEGTSVAVALGGPLLAASVVIEIAGALIARAASPAQVHAILAPIRALVALAVLALVFGRLEAALETVIATAP
jgi:flagellar biosynthetic protein FliR